ncbi:MAG: hypothetical protein RR100_02855 [Comamonas sp.]
MPAPLIHHSFEMRVAMLVERLQHIRPCASAQEAHDVVIEEWRQVHRDCHISPRYLALLDNRSLCAEHGWHDLDQPVCYFDSDELPPMRIYLHRDGSIVIQRMQPDNVQILFTLPSKRLRPRTSPG